MATLTFEARGESTFHTVEVPDTPAARGQESSGSGAAQAPAAPDGPAPAQAGFQAPAPVFAGGQPAAFAQFSAPAVPQPVQVAGVVADTHASTETGGGGRGAPTDAATDAASVDLMHYAEYGWHIVPSVQNQYGEAAPASDEWIQFAADFIPQDWFYA